ncbi:MAG TPA: hypothetical protein VKE40_14455 [Gemmataceae bacterium]|nr:hypothetical protein [Gemmataceae bacterium]
MNREEVFECWAPAGSTWSGWVKPVLFAHLPRPLPSPPEIQTHDLSWVPLAAEHVAFVIDIPGPASVELGLALAGRGYQPIPLFNACPPPVPDAQETVEDPSVVDVTSILTALVHGCERLRQAALDPGAPPAFLVDANRQTPRRTVDVGAFDNRSVVFVTDFPSAAFLAGRGITKVILVREQATPPDSDLAYALGAWQRAGIAIEFKALSQPGAPSQYRLPRAGWLAGIRLRLSAWLTGRRNAAGEFGEFVPAASGG